MLSTDKQTNRQTDRQTNQRYQKHNLLCQGGNKLKLSGVNVKCLHYLCVSVDIHVLLQAEMTKEVISGFFEDAILSGIK